MTHLTDNYDFELPNELIAQTPVAERDASRLLVLNKKTGALEHRIFQDITDYLTPNDVIVLNDTKVINARLTARRSTGGSIEIFLLNPLSDTRWTCLLKKAKRLSVGEKLRISDTFFATVCELNIGNMEHIIELKSSESILSSLEKYGNTPLPPYIKTTLTDTVSSRYQTVLAKNHGAVAAPTAGLHFTEALLSKIKKLGVQIETVTLHVGYGTFKPISAESILDHPMHYEDYIISEKTAQALNQAISNKKRIIAVGTTVTRTLESSMIEDKVIPGQNSTNLFIYPGYKFKIVNALITNFHTPRSTLLCLVSALASKKFIDIAYAEAIKERYRFYSFGDAMFICT